MAALKKKKTLFKLSAFQNHCCKRPALVFCILKVSYGSFDYTVYAQITHGADSRTMSQEKKSKRACFTSFRKAGALAAQLFLAYVLLCLV